MTKKQKIWLVVFLGMFIIPELLWEPVGNYIYAFIKDVPFRDNLLMHSDYRNVLIYVLIIQLLGVLLSFILLIKGKLYKNIKGGWMALLFLLILFFISFFILYALLATQNFVFRACGQTGLARCFGLARI